MFSPPNIPNHFPPPEDQGSQEEKKTLLAEVLSSVALRLILVGLVLLVAWMIIRGLSGAGGWFGTSVMDWVNEGSINPENERGFTFFLKLLLTTGFIGLVIAFLSKIRGE